MTDINSKIEAAKEEAAALQTKVSLLQSQKRDTERFNVSVATLAKIRSPPSVKVRRTLKGHFGKVTAMHWSGDSRLLVSASQDGNLLIWNPISNHKLEIIHLKTSYVMAVGIEQTNGNLVASGGLDNLCTVYPRNNPDRAVEMSGHEGFLSCCRFLSEKEILTSSGDSTCIRYDIESGTPISTFKEHTADAMFISLKDQNIFASCSVDTSTKIWDIRSPDRSVQTYKGFHNGDINAVEFMSTDTNCFATCSQDNTVRLFDMRAYNELSVFTAPTAPTSTVNNSSAAPGAAAGVPAAESIPNDGFTSLSFSKSGRTIFTGHADGNVIAFDVLTNSVAYTLAPAHERHVSCVGVCPAGDALCTGSWDTTLKIWA